MESDGAAVCFCGRTGDTTGSLGSPLHQIHLITGCGGWPGWPGSSLALSNSGHQYRLVHARTDYLRKSGEVGRS